VEEQIAEEIQESMRVKERVLRGLVPQIKELAQALIQAYRGKGKVVLFGNGGSAADAQHIACELVGRFEKGRRALPAIALSTNTSTLTAIGNDYGYEASFARQVEAFVGEGDIAIGISTSGNAANVLQGLRVAKEKGAKTVGLSGKSGGKLKSLVDLCLVVPSDSTPRIQEAHITIGHIICGIVERELFGPIS